MALGDDAMADGSNARIDSSGSTAEASDDGGDALQLSVEPASSRLGTDRSSLYVAQVNAELDTVEVEHENVAVDHDAAVDDTEVAILREDTSHFLQQINACPSAVDASTEEQQLDVLLSMRRWAERPKWQHAGTADRAHDSVFVPMQVVIDDEGLYCAIPYQDGVYRGQVAEAADGTPIQLGADAEDQATGVENAPPVLIPHGFGVWTSAGGSCRCGQWVHGEQIGVGTQQHRGVLLYEGEWVNDFPTGAGIGTFADGSSFAGQWVKGRPCGIGSLRIVENEMTANEEKRSSFGWFYGTQCLQQCHRSSEREDEDKKAVRSVPDSVQAVLSEFQDQPLRGLYVAAMRLEDWRISTFQRVLDHWRLVCCEQAVESAKQSRLLAMIVWQKAHAAQQKAIETHILQVVEQRKCDDRGLVQLTLKSREKHARVLHVRQFHEQRRATSEFQCELARCCVGTQQDTVDLMESELSAVVNLLQEAKQAQADCSAHRHQLQLIKRQIESVSLKINDVRLRQERERFSIAKAGSFSRAVPATSTLPGIPVTTTSGVAKNRADGFLRIEWTTSGGNQTDRDVMVINPDYVCNVPGCECGIPRDVFMRVGAALNGES